MAINRDSPDLPRSEPEIIPPDAVARRPRGSRAVWMRIDERDGVRRVVIGQPSTTVVILGLMFLALIAAVAFLALAGFLLLWIPIVLGGILLALGSAAIRRRSRLWWARLTGRP
jgi:hypothetical protein